MRAKLGSAGIRKTARLLGRSVSQLTSNALHAAKRFLHSSSGLNFVATGANSAANTGARLSVVGSSQMALLSSASVASATSKPNGQTLPGIAQKHAGCVIAVEELSRPMRVRNLTVERAHVFYANGFLTHNCDALGLVGQLLDHMDAGSPLKIASNEPMRGIEKATLNEILRASEVSDSSYL
jgi:hypothetical protein